MNTLLHRWLRPTHRARRAVVALVVVALLDWVALTAGHVHLDGHAPHAHPVAHASDAHAAGGDGGHHDHDGDRGDRSPPCGLCAAFERAAGAATAPTVAITVGPDRTLAADLPDRLPVVRSAAPYRSRAPPHA